MPVKLPPYRSPKAVSEAIKDHLQDKIVCELGCAEGDNMEFMAQYAKKVIGFEYMQERYTVAQDRGFDVTVGDYYKDEIPDADVYYFWPDDGERDSEYLVQKILQKPGFKGKIIIGADTGFPPEVPALKRCSKLGQLLEIQYNEGVEHRQHGTFLVAIIDASKLKQKCILLLSSPRAGSSCSTACLSLCGLSIGKNLTTVQDRFNAKGYFENQRLLTFNEKILQTVGLTIFAQRPLNTIEIMKSLGFKEELKQILKEEFGDNKFFLIKDPRINLLQDLYTSVFSELDIDIAIAMVHRDANNVAKSVLKMIPGVSHDQAVKSHEVHYTLAYKLAKNKTLSEFQFHELIADPNAIMKKVCFDLAIPYGVGRHNQDKITNFVERKLVHHG